MIPLYLVILAEKHRSLINGPAEPGSLLGLLSITKLWGLTFSKFNIRNIGKMRKHFIANKV